MATNGLDLFHTPSEPPPPGVIPNFVDPPTRAGTVIAASAVLLTLSTLFVLLRCYTRFVLVCVYGISDYLLLAGYCVAVLTTAFSIVDTTRGFGRHNWDVPLGNLFPYIARSIWWQIKLYTLALGLLKLAILGLFYHLSPFRKFRVYVWALVALVICCTLCGLLWSIFNCFPPSNTWSLEAVGKCPQSYGFIYYSGTINITTDLAILILPIVILRHITLSPKKKIGVAIVLTSGSLASLISVARMVISIKSSRRNDQSWNNVDLIVWSSSELHATVICACLPTLRPFVRRFFPPCMGGSTQESSSLQPSREGIELEQHKKKDQRKPNTDSTGTSWVLERITSSNEGKKNQDNASEEHILSDKNHAPLELDVTAGRGQSSGTDIERAV